MKFSANEQIFTVFGYGKKSDFDNLTGDSFGALHALYKTLYIHQIEEFSVHLTKGEGYNTRPCQTYLK